MYPLQILGQQNNTVVIENHIKIIFAFKNTFYGRQGNGVGGR